MISKEEKPLMKVRRKRNLTLRDLYFKINKEIELTRLSDIQVGRKAITKKEIDILNKYLELSEQEIEDLEEMEIDKEIEEACKMMDNLLKVVPKDLQRGQEIIEKCPRCGNKLRIARASINGHLWITCEKEGVLLCE